MSRCLCVSFRDADQWFGDLRLMRDMALGADRVPRTPGPNVLLGAGNAVDLQAEIPRALHAVAKQAEWRGCRLEYAVQPHLIAAVDPADFHAAVVELLRQAIARADRKVLVTVRRDDGAVRLTVSDDGPGESGSGVGVAGEAACRLLRQFPGVRVMCRGSMVVVLMPGGVAVAGGARPGLS